MKVSAVIVVNRHAETLAASAILSATIGQTVVPDELVVIDYGDSSFFLSPVSSHVLSSVASQVDVKIVRREDPKHCGVMRTQMVEIASYDYVWMLEDDLFVSSNSLHELKLFVSANPCAAKPKSLSSSRHVPGLSGEGKHWTIEEYRKNYLAAQPEKTLLPLLHAMLMPKFLLSDLYKEWASIDVCSDMVFGKVVPSYILPACTVHHLVPDSQKVDSYLKILNGHLATCGGSTLRWEHKPDE